MNKYPITTISPVYINNVITDFFDPRNEVYQLTKDTPKEVIIKFERARITDLQKGIKNTYTQKIKDYANSNPVTMVVEVTRILIDIPYNKFILIISPELWGKNLAGYLGGEVNVLKKNEQLRATHQIERMVLKAPFKNLDMTKSEIIEYENDKSKVYWRVFHSDNETTISDIGYVEFSQSKSGGTIVTFQSAHKLYLPNSMVKFSLANTFMDHLRKYKKIVGEYTVD